jgi:hypothetical protein
MLPRALHMLASTVMLSYVLNPYMKILNCDILQINWSILGVKCAEGKEKDL